MFNNNRIHPEFSNIRALCQKKANEKFKKNLISHSLVVIVKQCNITKLLLIRANAEINILCIHACMFGLVRQAHKIQTHNHLKEIIMPGM